MSKPRPYRLRLATGAPVDTMRELTFDSVDVVAGVPPWARPQAWHEQWLAEALRVLRPGGSLLAVGSPRTGHRVASAAERVGYTPLNTLAWLHGEGYTPVIRGAKAGIPLRGKPVVLSHHPQCTYGKGVLGPIPVDAPWRVLYQKRATSRAAAQTNSPLRITQRLRVYAYLMDRGPLGATDNEVERALEMKRQSVIPARYTLGEMGYVVATDERRLTDTGHPAIVWRGVPRHLVGETWHCHDKCAVARAKRRKLDIHDLLVTPGRRGAPAEDLLRALLREAAPQGGRVLVPFPGDGTLVLACYHEAMQCLAVQPSAPARARINQGVHGTFVAADLTQE